MCGVNTFFLLVKHVGIPLARRWKQEEVGIFTTINLCNRWHDIPTKKEVWKFIWMPILPQSLSERKIMVIKGYRNLHLQKAKKPTNLTIQALWLREAFIQLIPESEAKEGKQ